MNIKIEVQMTVRVMYNYVLQHAYTSLSGILGVVFGIVCMVFGLNGVASGEITQSSLVALFLGVMFVLVNPILLWQKARKQVKSTPSFQKPLHYELNEEGITVSQDGQSTTVTWDKVMKVTATNMSIIVYFSRLRAFILPKEDLGDNYANAVQLMYAQVPTNKVKIRTVS